MKIRISKEHGSVLMLTLVTAGTLGIGLASYLKLVQAQNRSVMSSQVWNSAIPAAEAGIEEALTHLNIVGDDNRAQNGWTADNGQFVLSRTIGDIRYAVAISSSNQPSITSTGFVKVATENREISRVVHVQTTRFSAGMRGMVAKGNITMNGNCEADSFDSEDPNHSTNGRYDSAKRKDGTFVGSVHANVVTGGGKIYGTVGTGPTGSASGNVGTLSWLSSNSGIQSGHYQNDLSMSFPDVPAPWSGGAYSPPQNVTVTTTNFTYATTATTSATYPSPEPASGVTTNVAPITTTSYPIGFAGPVTTNTSAFSSQSYPTAGSYVGNVVTRIVTSGPRSGRGTWYDYQKITGYTYTTTTYTYNTVTTNSTTTTETYDYVLDSANYETTSLSLSGQSKMLIRGEAVLYVTGNVSMTGQSQIIILPGASLKIYVAGSANLAGNGVMNLNADATKFSYFGLPSNTSISIGGNAAFTGTIYAPNAHLHLHGGGNNVYDCVGATVTSTVAMNGHFNFHYDEKLGRQGGPTRFRVASWAEL
ncbi:MAG: hypothetical protein SFY81_07930 [Verrucomicrobiota bacterium]|nr:hypothetical protein [Verrucomicrobiota bacterium]